MPAKAKIQCKECKDWMPMTEWMDKTHCENPNCKCPEVQKLIKATQEVINKAQTGSNSISVNRASVPHGYDDTAANDQYVIDVPDVKVIWITPIPSRMRK